MKFLGKVLAFSMALVLFLNTCFFVSAEPENVKDAAIKDVVMTVGADETMRNLTWFSDCNTDGDVLYAKADDMNGDSFPADHYVANALAKPAEVDGQYSYKATMRGLEENTEYIYCIVVGDTVSENFSFEVKTFGNEFSFAYVTDVQFVDEEFAEDWADTMDKFLTIEEFKDASILVSGGDQVQENNETLYDKFINDDLRSFALAPSYGRLHDEGSLYDQHFNLPNLSSAYGSDLVTADYYYTYNNVLFMHLNAVSADYDGHIAFMENAVATNPDCTWKIVVMHYSFFTEGRHSTDSRVTNLRDAIAGKINELGVDLVLSGHDHVYVRSNMMLDGETVSSDVVTNNTVTDPEGTLYICGTKGSSRNFYDIDTPVSDPAIALRVDDDLKSAMTVSVADDSLVIRSYFINEETPVEFDNFTIYKTGDASAEMPDSYAVTYVDELGADFGDDTDVSLYAKRYFTTTTPDEPRLSVPTGSLDDGIKLNWSWEYYLADGDGTAVTQLVNGNDYVAYLRCETLKMSRNISIAMRTNAEECIYTWDDAWELIYQYPGEAFTFTLTEDITVSTENKVIDVLNVTVDLNGYTLNANTASRMLTLSSDANGTSFKVISSQPGGVLNTGSKPLSRIETGKSSQVSMQFGSPDTYPITVTASTFVTGASSFYKGIFNLDIYAGVYNFSRSIFDVRNSGTDDNTYKVRVYDATINMTSSSIYQYEDKYAGADSSFTATNSVFTGGNTKTPKDFFGSNVWKGTAAFTECVFNNIVCDSALHTNLKGITIDAGCVFNNSGNTFTAITKEPEIPEVPEEPSVLSSINYNFELYNNSLFSEHISGNASKYISSATKKAIEAAYPDSHNWIVENWGESVDSSTLRFNTNQGFRMSIGAGNWVALRMNVNAGAKYKLEFSSVYAYEYNAQAWLISADADKMTASDIEVAMIEDNRLNDIVITTTQLSCDIGECYLEAGEYILVLRAEGERIYLGNIDFTGIPEEEEPDETPEDTGNSDWENLTTDSSLGFASSKVSLAEDCAVISVDEDTIATVNKDSVKLTVFANKTNMTAGSTLKYTVTCENTLSADISVVLRGVIPNGTSLVSADNGGACSGNSVCWNLTIPADSKTTVSYDLTVTESGELANQAIATIDGLSFTTNKVICDLQVAKIGDKMFASLEDALAAAVSGDTIILQVNVSSMNVILPANVDLDLNGCILTADSVLTYSSGSIIDTSENASGLLKITEPDGNMISKDNGQLPVYDSVNGGYRFFAIDVEPCAVTGINKYWFKVKAEKFVALYELICSESEVLFKVKMTWDNQTEDAYAAADLTFTKTWADSYNANEDVYITVYVTEAEGFENVKLTPMVTSCGVEIAGEEM